MSKNSIETIKECEKKAEKIIEDARIRAREDMLLALKKKEEETVRAIEEEKQAIEKNLSNIMKKIDVLLKDKEKEVESRAGDIIEKAMKNLPKAVNLIIKK